MQTRTDAELLREYATSRSEAAFGEIVRRYADFVYSAALRQMNNPEQARDVAQVVFVTLAKKAGSLRAETLLIGWLCQAARLAALEQIRMQQRRSQRERQAMDWHDPSPETPDDWTAVRPVLDEAIASLGDEDRHALLLRFFKGESLASVGATLGVSEDAAQKRVSRALTKLREFLAGRGITTSTTALSTALATNAVHAAPVGLAASLTTSALANASAATVPIMKILTMKTAIVALIAAGGLAGLTAANINTQHQLRDTRELNRQQAEELKGLREANQQLTAQSAAGTAQRADNQELVSLRGEVARLHAERNARTVTASSKPSPKAGSSEAEQPRGISLRTRFISLPADQLQSLNLNWTPNGQGGVTTLLSAEQFKAINETLAQSPDAKVLASPRAVVASGNEATMSLSRAGSTTRVATSSGSVGGGGVGTSGSSSAGDFGSRLQLILRPEYAEGSHTFHLDIDAQAGNAEEKCGIKANVAVPEDQTLAIAAEVPSGAAAEAGAPQSILVFVTPTLDNGRYQDRLVNVIQRSNSSTDATAK